MISIKNRLIHLVVGIWLLVLAACAPATGEIPVTGNELTEAPAVENVLANTSWSLVSYGSRNAQLQVAPGTEVTLQFNSDGSLSGNGGCNSFGGQYNLIPDYKLTIHNIISTKMACTQQTLMDQENQYFQALQSAGKFDLSGNNLTIWYSGEENALHFSRAMSSTPTPSTASPTALNPTAVVNPTTTSGNAKVPQRIAFTPGATSATVTGQLSASGSDLYVLHGLADQTMSINMNFTAGQAILAVWGADGNILLSDHAEVSTFQGVLPLSQDYYIQVEGYPNGSTAYSMSVNIPSTNPVPERIEFAPGATSATVTGRLTPSGSDLYVLHALADQTMSINMNFTAGQAILTVWGADGTVLLTDHAAVSSFQRALPTTQDYYIRVEAYPNGNTAYSMTVTIPTAATNTVAERITFAPGSTSATVTGQLAASGSDLYILHALAGQTMTINMTFSAGEAILVVWGADGTVLLTDHAEASSFNRVLSSTQDYYIQVEGRSEGNSAYSMTVSIPPLASP